MPYSADDRQYLQRALRLAARGRYRVAPNPMVGAVLVRDGVVMGEGYHAAVGEPHAEAVALHQAGPRAQGASLFVTLEPCAHWGRTPPCADALIAAGVARVVACHRDPDPRTAGAGFARLAAAGITVEVGLLGREAAEQNLHFLVPRVCGRPAVTLKWAMSLDGKIATASGESQWISGPRSRHAALRLREAHDAVLVGSGTVLADDPRLDRRLGRARQPGTRVVLDGRLRTPPGARLFQAPGPVLMYTRPGSPASRRAALAALGATVVELPELTPTAVLGDLFRRDIHSVLVEGGAEVVGSFVAAGVWDRLTAFCAPLVLGGAAAPGPVGGSGAAALAAAPRVDRLRVVRRGADVLLWGYRQPCLPDLFASVGVS